MIGNVLIHVAILLGTCTGLAEREFENPRTLTERPESATRADDEHKKGDSTTAAENQTVELSASTGQRTRLEPFAGTFNAEVKLWTGRGDPMVSAGLMTSKLVLGGRYLQQAFKGDPSPNTEGYGFWGCNQATNKYEGFWLDTNSARMRIEVGDVDDTGRVWTMFGEIIGPTGNAMKKRSVITLEDNDHHKVEMFFTRPDGTEVKILEINYERA